MKKSIHPTYFNEAKIICSCGNTLTVGSTVKEAHVEICSSCHPFFTGKKKIIDAAGRVDRFKAREEKSRKLQEERIKSRSTAKKKAAKVKK